MLRFSLAVFATTTLVAFVPVLSGAWQTTDSAAGALAGVAATGNDAELAGLGFGAVEQAARAQDWLERAAATVIRPVDAEEEGKPRVKLFVDEMTAEELGPVDELLAAEDTVDPELLADWDDEETLAAAAVAVGMATAVAPAEAPKPAPKKVVAVAAKPKAAAVAKPRAPFATSLAAKSFDRSLDALTPRLPELPLARGFASAPKIPPQPADMTPGSVVMREVEGLGIAERERRLAHELTRGNIPSFLRQLAAVKITDGNRSVTLHVMPDYLAVGTDTDFVRVPLSRLLATRVARAWGFTLPTTRIVDEIYEQAQVQVKPAALPAGAAMTAIPYLLRHESMVKKSLGSRYRPGQLVAGIKKDLVLSSKLSRRPDRVAIYGWHQPDAHPIQPLSDVHGGLYSDYSHGIRLVSVVVEVDGATRSIYDVLNDPNLASLVSDEGRLSDARMLMLPGR